MVNDLRDDGFRLFWKQLCAGEEWACEKLLADVGGATRKWLAHRFGADTHVLNDCVQEACTRVLERIPPPHSLHFETRPELQKYMNKTAQSILAEEHRRWWNVVLFGRDTGGRTAEDLIHAAEEWIRGNPREAEKLLTWVFATIVEEVENEDHRRIFSLRYRDGLSMKEIAAAMKYRFEPGNIRTILHRCTEKLKARARKEDGFAAKERTN